MGTHLGPKRIRLSWPEFAAQIESRHRGEYDGAPAELKAIDEAEASGIAREEEVDAAFRGFRRE